VRVARRWPAPQNAAVGRPELESASFRQNGQELSGERDVLSLASARVGPLRSELHVPQVEGVVRVAGNNPEAGVGTLEDCEELLQRRERTAVEILHGIGQLIVACARGDERSCYDADRLMEWRRGQRERSL
jgi:hypothetical protein